MDERGLYSSRTIKTYLEYLQKKHPEVDRDPILNYAGISRYELEDDGHWLTQTQVDRFHEELDRLTKDPNIARDAGRYSFSSGSLVAVRQYILGFVSPFTAFSVIEKFASMLTRGHKFTTRKLEEDKIEVTVHLQPGVKEKKFQCENRMGTLEALTRFFTIKLPQIEHLSCVHNGDDCCRYIITIERTPISLWKRIQRFTSLLIIPVSIFYFFVSLPIWLMTCLLYLILLASISLYSEHLSKRQLIQRMESQSDSAGRLLDQINKGYNNALLIQEIGQAISNVMEIEALLGHIMETLQKRLDFDRGAIMLSTPDKSRLVYTVGYGYSAEYEEYLKKVEFNLNKPKVKAPFSVAFKEQKPILVDNVKDIEQDLSLRSQEFARIMESESFICAPIIYKGESLGILTVDNIHSKRHLSQSDMSLLIGVANQIAISINNSISYQKIRESEDRFRSLSENAPDIIFTIDERAKITYVNPAWERQLGHPPKEILNRHLVDFAKRENIDLYLSTFKRVWEHKEAIYNFELSLLKENKTEKYFISNLAPNIDQEDQVSGIVGILKDITEQRNLEAQLRQAQKMEAIGTLAGGIAHDFNNILGAVMGYTEMAMADLSPDGHVYQYLDQVFKSSTRAKDLVRQILAFSRQTEQEFKPVKISPIVKETTKLLRASIPTTIAINLDIKTERDTLLADPTQIHQVLMNLCTNAAHATQEKGGSLAIVLNSAEVIPQNALNARKAKPGPYLELSIRDTGSGMDSVTLDRIFDPFFTTKKPGEGTGMGLSVVHGIVKSHGGAIMVESQPNQGTTFHVYFPLAVADDIPQEREDHSPIIGGIECILFVDDEPPLVQLGKEMLERIGYEVVGRTNGMEALSLFQAQPERFDLVITDLTMPNMTGTELAETILKIRPEIPVIICTGFSESLSIEKVKKMGIREIVLKPVVTRKIAAVIRRELDKNIQ